MLFQVSKALNGDGICFSMRRSVICGFLLMRREYVLKQQPEYAELFDQVLESERTGIIQCARILLRNTDNSDLQKLIQDFLGTQYWNFDLTDVFWLSEEYDLENGACAEYLYPAFLEICDDRTYLLFFRFAGYLQRRV